jgi:acyl-CoA thioesterase-2
MSKVLDELVQQLALERIEQNLFRGQSQDLGWGTVFGGQVLGQALSAATQTVPPERRVHSLHAYFLLPGNVSKPIVYDVDDIRDGSSFTTRRVVAIQSGRAIFNLAASFQKPEPGFVHQASMPEVPEPLSVPTEQQRLLEQGERVPRHLREQAMEERPFELRAVEVTDDPIAPSALPPSRRVWMRAVGQLPDDPAVHASLLAYASDFGFVSTALFPHAVTVHTPGMQVASLDHVMWFHQPFRVDDWLLYVIDSPAAHGARGLVRGSIFARDGRLVASAAQEGLMRQRERKSY